MKKLTFLILIISFTACTNKLKVASQRFIEPSLYSAVSYEVKDTSYHSIVQKILSDSKFVTIKGDSLFDVSDELGQLLFNGSHFSYKVLDDSLFLLNNQEVLSYKILEFSPNSFKIEVRNRYFRNIHFLKTLENRRRIVQEVKIKF